LRLKILKKLRTASLNSELTGSYKKSVIGDQSDHTLGSLTYLSEEYDKFSAQMHNLKKLNI